MLIWAQQSCVLTGLGINALREDDPVDVNCAGPFLSQGASGISLQPAFLQSQQPHLPRTFLPWLPAHL